MRFVLLLFLLVSFSIFSQEKRLALVIGNANYTKGALQNPVNDALLMKRTLEELDFDVILDTNITTLAAFNETVRKFGEKRDEYNVGFIYYAGHGIQLNDINYLLATKEEYKTEFDVEDKALSVQKIMRYLTSRTDEVNVLILDACRDNPFEQNWNPAARSTEGGRGLARLSPPTGSLIAYSTDAGNTAADGKGSNSVYCLSLTKNMVVESITLDQVFRNVRADVLNVSSGRQRPVEASQLTGEAFYLKKGTFTDQIIEIDSLIDANNYALALEKTTRILFLSPQNKDALLRKGQIQYNTIGKKYDGTDLFKARELYPKDPDVHIFIARYYAIIGEGEKGISEIERALKLDSTNSEAFYWMARISFEDLDRGDKSIEAISTAIRLSPMNTLYYSYRGNILRDKLKLFDQALTDFSKAIELDPTDVDYYYQRGVLYDDYLNQDEKALKDYQKTLEIDPAYVDAINAIGVIYEEQGKLDLAIAQYEKGMALEKSNPTAAAFCYSNRASLYANQKKLDEALKDYTKAIELDPKNPDLYHNRAIFFIDVMEDFNNALIDYSKAIELDPRDVDYYYKRGTLYYDYLNQDEKALMDCQKILEIDPAYVDAINVIGVIYEDQNKLDLAIEQYTKGVELEKVAPQSAALCYSNRARIYSLQGKYEEALSDFSKAIELDEKNPHKYFLRADFFIENLDDPNSALKDYSMAIELNPDELLFYYLRGVVYNEHLNQKDKAIKDFQKVLEIDPNDVDAINEIGLIFEEQGRIDLAIEQYSKGIILENSIPQSAAFCYSNRARIYQEQGNLTLALQDYTKAIALDQNNILHFYNRGDFYNYKMKRPYEALVDYSLALTLDSQNMYPWFQRGLLFSAELNDHRSAINDFQQILRIDSNDVTVLNWIGVFYARLQDEETEKDYYLRTIAKENYKFDDSLQMHVNGISYAYQNLAEMLQTTDEKTKAYEYYTKAILFDKTNPEKFYYRGWFLASYTDNYDDALEDLNKSVGLENDNPKWHLNRAKILYLKGDYKSAKKDFDQAVKLSEESAIYLAERGNFYSKIGDFKKAQFDFNNALMKDSTVRITYHFMTENYIRQKMENEAIHFTQSTAMRFDNDTVSYEQLGRLYLEKKELLKSLKAYQTAAAIMDYNLAYRTIEPGADQIYISDVYGQIATIYGLLNEKDLQCDALQNAKGNLGFETRPNKKEVEEILKEKISNVCN